MSTSAPPPKLSAWIFYAADLALLAAAVFIAMQASRPLTNSAIFGIVACVIAGAIVGTVPHLVEYEREKNAALDERQSALEGLSRTIANSADQISAAATGLHAIAELAHKNLRHAEQLPHKLQEKIAEFQVQIANANDSEKEELEKELAALRSSESEHLESISDRIAKSVVEFARLQTQLQKQLAAVSPARPPAESPQRPKPGSSDSENSGLSSHPTPSVETDSSTTVSSVATARGVSLDEPAPVEIAPVAPDTHSPYPAQPIELEIANSALSTAANAKSPARKPLRKRSEKTIDDSPPEKLPGLEILPARVSAPSKPAPLSEKVSASDDGSTADIAAASSISADGVTRLVVTAYIGIGNRLFIRGEGPGLSWDKGIPLQFVSIGKWRWEVETVPSPVKFKIFKNDQTECDNLGLQTLTPGHQKEINVTF